MGGTVQLLGTHHYRMDPKGRISLPGEYREAFRDGVVLTLSQDRCLAAYPREEWDRYTAGLEDLDTIGDRDSRSYVRFVLGRAEQGSVDAQGRLGIPRGLRDRVELAQDITVVGVGDHAEIWSRDEFERFEVGQEAAFQSGELRPGTRKG